MGFVALTGSLEQIQEAERVREKGYSILHRYFTDTDSDSRCQAIVNWSKQISSAGWWLSIKGLFDDQYPESCIAWMFATKLRLCYDSYLLEVC